MECQLFYACLRGQESGVFFTVFVVSVERKGAVAWLGNQPNQLIPSSLQAESVQVEYQALRTANTKCTRKTYCNMKFGLLANHFFLNIYHISFLEFERVQINYSKPHLLF